MEDKHHISQPALLNPRGKRKEQPAQHMLALAGNYDDSTRALERIFLMLVSFNLTTSSDDMDRFETRDELRALMDGFDGVELMWFGDNDLVTPDMVSGVHLNCKETWYDFWTGNEEALIAEIGEQASPDKLEGICALFRRFLRALNMRA